MKRSNGIGVFQFSIEKVLKKYRKPFLKTCGNRGISCLRTNGPPPEHSKRSSIPNAPPEHSKRSRSVATVGHPTATVGKRVFFYCSVIDEPNR